MGAAGGGSWSSQKAVGQPLASWTAGWSGNPFSASTQVAPNLQGSPHPGPKTPLGLSLSIRTPGKDTFLVPVEFTGSGKSSLAWGGFDRDTCHFSGPSGNSLYCLKPHFCKRNCSSCSEGHTHWWKG